MKDAKVLEALAAPDVKLSIEDGELIQNPSTYRQIVGVLQHLTFIRP